MKDEYGHQRSGALIVICSLISNAAAVAVAYVPNRKQQQWGFHVTTPGRRRQ